MKKILFTGMFAFAVTASYLYGLASHKYLLQPFPLLLNLKNHLFPGSIGYSDMSSRVPLPCAGIKSRRMMVALAFGQSNSGNHGETLYRPKYPVFNFFNGRCYRAEDPLLGATGDRGSVWSRLGDLLIQRGLYDKVMIIPIGVGSTTIEQWTARGYLHSRIVDAVREAQSNGFTITHLFWVQGGSEKNTSGNEENKKNYKKNFLEMLGSIRSLGVDAPIYVAVSTYNGAGFNRDIQEAQRELAGPKNRIYAGPDNDRLYRDKTNEWEQVHLSNKGLERCTRSWLEAIRRVEGK
ncbi:MAG: hypothetical protein A2W19_09495 [Spirochaetes bacterium RBG_16_49_21]|nr:MAG: hypothetical protein A2W19_09495 [Spirochaetes bacterium RBG_16_49_21]